MSAPPKPPIATDSIMCVIAYKPMNMHYMHYMFEWPIVYVNFENISIINFCGPLIGAANSGCCYDVYADGYVCVCQTYLKYNV